MIPLHLVRPQRIKNANCLDMCDLLKASTLKPPHWLAPIITHCGMLIHIHSNCILKENALREPIMEWHMNRIISTKSPQGRQECRTLYLTGLKGEPFP